MQLVHWGLSILTKKMTQENRDQIWQTKKDILNFKSTKTNKMKTYFIDSFTAEKFKGNPAAVCLVETEIEETTMQNIAAEIGFSETAFIQKRENAVYGIRFFTPYQEIALCGHATLASAKVVFEIGNMLQLLFVNKDGVRLPIEKVGDKIKMQFPVYNTTSFNTPPDMLQALGFDSVIDSRYNKEMNIVMIEMSDANKLQQLKPDIAGLLKSYKGINGVLITAKSNLNDYDFEYRYFWPWIGTDEDPVTGAVHTFLTPYWSEKLNKKQLKAIQSSQRTGSMETDWQNGTVYIYGQAVQTLEGSLNL